MYTAEYSTLIRFNNKKGEQFSDGKWADLIAHFRFWDEVNPDNRKTVKERLQTSLNQRNLKNYLEMVGFEYDISSKSFKDEDRVIPVIQKRYHLGLDIVVKTKLDKQIILPLEKMLDLDGLNRFILTGKMPWEK